MHEAAIENPERLNELTKEHQRSVIEQVEIGTDGPDFPTALRPALRQAPDVIVVGEMRDAETMRIAVVAAETGHLVLSTLHTTDVASTVARITDSFPVERQNAVRQELAMALSAVLTQILLPTKNGSRMPAAELLVVGYGARHHIRRNNLHYLHQEIPLTKKRGLVHSRRIPSDPHSQRRHRKRGRPALRHPSRRPEYPAQVLCSARLNEKVQCKYRLPREISGYGLVCSVASRRLTTSRFSSSDNRSNMERIVFRVSGSLFGEESAVFRLPCESRLCELR